MHTLFPHYPLLKIKLSFGQTLRGNKHCCIHRLLESIKQLASLLCQASRGFTMASPISPPPKPISKKKVRFSKDGQMQRNHQELPMLRLCHRAGHQAARSSQGSHWPHTWASAGGAGTHCWLTQWWPSSRRKSLGRNLPPDVAQMWSEQECNHPAAAWIGWILPLNLCRFCSWPWRGGIWRNLCPSVHLFWGSRDRNEGSAALAVVCWGSSVPPSQLRNQTLPGTSLSPGRDPECHPFTQVLAAT